MKMMKSLLLGIEGAGLGISPGGGTKVVEGCDGITTEGWNIEGAGFGITGTETGG